MLRALAIALMLAALAPQAQALVILQYHHISDDTPAATSTSPALFQQHLELIEASGYAVVTLETVEQVMRARQAPPDKTVLITFDDSYSSIYTTAYPLLKARGWPFVIFANTEPVDQGLQGFLSWDALREMGEHGAAIANHTRTHPHLVRRPPGQSLDAWREGARREILQAEQRIFEETGQRHRVLAFPYGEYDAGLLELLSRLDYLGMSQSSGAVAAEDGLAMPRFPLGGRYGRPEDFKLKLRALPAPTVGDHTRIYDGEGKHLVDGVLPPDVARPVLEVKLKQADLAPGLQCYASGQVEAISKSAAGDTLRFRADRPLPAGRSRYNCTVRDPASGRYHWFSIPFLRPRPDGSWPPEP